MSRTRCGITVSRNQSITTNINNQSRELLFKKKVICPIYGEAKFMQNQTPPFSNLKENIRKEEKIDLAELTLQNLIKEKQEGKGALATSAAVISNLFPDSDENARDIFPGEKHAIVKLKNNRYGRASYTGPGTRIIRRLRRNGGDPPRVLSDKVSQAHDIRYSLAKNEADIRSADVKMLSSLKNLRQNGLDRNQNIIPAMIGIRGKIAAENFGLLSKSKFINPKFKPTDNDVKLLNNKLNELEQEGFGRTNTNIPLRTTGNGRTNTNPPLRTTGNGRTNTNLTGNGYPGVNKISFSQKKKKPVMQKPVMQKGEGEDLPGVQLLKKIRKKIEKNKRKVKIKRNPIFMDEHRMSGVLARELLPNL